MGRNWNNSRRNGGGSRESKFERALAVVPRTTNTAELREVDCILPETDLNGQTSRMSLKLTPAMESALLNIVQSGHWGYKNTGQVIRHAILRHLEDLKVSQEENPAPVSTNMQFLRVMSDYTRDSVIEEQTYEALEMIAQQAINYAQRNDPFRARQLLSKLRSRIKQMPESQDRENFMRQFDVRFNAFINGHIPTLGAEQSAQRFAPAVNGSISQSPSDSYNQPIRNSPAVTNRLYRLNQQGED